MTDRKSPEFIKSIKEDRELFLKIMKDRIEGAGPDDYKEYNFNDI